MAESSHTHNPPDGGATGVVFDIQRFSLEDGPGIRTSVFLKGCPLDCPWCSNPESKKPDPELAYFSSQCRRCFRCIDACPAHALARGREGPAVDRARCDGCGECTAACAAGALVLIGERMTVSRVMKEVLKDRHFYEESGGGVTITGGEPLFQADFTSDLLGACGDEGIQTAVETSGFASWENMRTVLERTDVVLYDLKLIDQRESMQQLGAASRGIIENLMLLDGLGKDIHIRLPLIPGHTDSRGNLEAIAEVILRLRHCAGVDILPFHQYGKHKYAGIGSRYTLDTMEPLRREDACRVVSFFEERNVSVKVLGA